MKKTLLTEMSSALRPFTLCALAYGADAPDWDEDDKISIRVSIGDFRRAVAALASAQEEN